MTQNHRRPVVLCIGDDSDRDADLTELLGEFGVTAERVASDLDPDRFVLDWREEFGTRFVIVDLDMTIEPELRSRLRMSNVPLIGVGGSSDGLAIDGFDRWYSKDVSNEKVAMDIAEYATGVAREDNLPLESVAIESLEVLGSVKELVAEGRYREAILLLAQFTEKASLDGGIWSSLQSIPADELQGESARDPKLWNALNGASQNATDADHTRYRRASCDARSTQPSLECHL